MFVLSSRFCTPRRRPPTACRSCGGASMTASSSNTIPVRRRTRSFARTGHTATARCTTISPLRNTSPMPRPSGSAAGLDGSLREDANVESMYFISTLPWLHYSALIQPVAGGEESNPRITWGAFVPDAEGRLANAGDAARPPRTRRRQPYGKVLRRAARRARRPRRGRTLIHQYYLYAGAGETISPAPVFLC